MYEYNINCIRCVYHIQNAVLICSNLVNFWNKSIWFWTDLYELCCCVIKLDSVIKWLYMASCNWYFCFKVSEHNSLYRRLVVEVFGYLEKENITFLQILIVFYTQQHKSAYAVQKQKQKLINKSTVFFGQTQGISN